jgi:hypothetical protein
MDDVSISYSSIIKANQVQFFLSSNLISINKEEINNLKNNLFKLVNCHDITEYFLKLNKLTKDNSYSLKLISGKENISDVTYYEILQLNNDVSKEYILLLKEFQKIISIYILENNNFTDKVFYLPTFADNRGRQYYSTILSPTFNKLFRYLYEFNEKKKFINLEDSKFYKKIIKYSNLVLEFNLSTKNSYILIVLLIEVGKFFISSVDNYIIETEKIINIGINNYKIKNKQLDFSDLLYIQKIYVQIDNLLQGNISENTIIFKDATASGLQNYGVLLGYKEEKLQYLNIDGDNYCDTYQYVINLYLENKKFSKRKY